MLLDGKVALVTGASRGIGRAIAIRLASEGAKVAINFAGNQKAAEEVKGEIEKNGGEAILVKANVADSAAVDEMFAKVIEAFGTVDILVNNAGITRDGLLIRMKDEDFDAVIDTNLKGVFYCTKAAAKIMMKKRSGRIVNMSSVVGLMAMPARRTTRQRRLACSASRSRPPRSSRRAASRSTWSLRASLIRI